MGDIYRRIVTEFRATGGQQILATLGQVRGGTQQWRREMEGATRQGGYLENQMRALGTTMRYAFAGSVIFGVANMVRNLSQMQVQLGQIAALATQIQGGQSVPLTPGQIQNIGSASRHGAVESLTPINEFNDALINLYSTVQNVPPNQAVEMVKETGLAAKVMQLNITDAQQAFFQMQFAFRRPHTLKELKKQQREFFSLIQAAPGGVAAGPQIIQQLGPLSRVSAFGRGTQEQMLATTLQALRGGGTPATNLRGLQFLLQTISAPQAQEKSSQAALASIGVTQEFIQQHGVFQGLLKVIKAIRGGGVNNAGNLKNLGEEELGTLDTGDPATAMSSLGVTGGGAQFAAKAFHRIHALRTAIGLAVQGPDELLQGLDLINNAGKDMSSQANSLDRAVKDFKREAPLAQAAQAIQSMQLDIANAFGPILSFPARGLVGLEGQFSKHETAGTVALATLLGGGLIGARRASGVGRGLGRVGTGAILAQGLGNVGGAPGTSPANPLFVYIVGQLSNPFGGPGTPGGVVLGPNGQPLPPGATASRWSRLGRGLGGAAMMATMFGPIAWSSYKETRGLDAAAPDRDVKKLRRGGLQLLSYLGESHFNALGQRKFAHDPTAKERETIDRYLRHEITAQEAETRLRGIASPMQLQQAGVGVHGKLQGNVDVTIRDKNGAVLQRDKAHVTLDVIDDISDIFGFGKKSTPPAPQTRGKNQTRRGGR